jgi:hypothetical protein
VARFRGPRPVAAVAAARERRGGTAQREDKADQAIS